MLTPEETAILVEKAIQGEASAFSSLIKEHLRAAYLTALAVVERPSDAEDVAQDAFLAAFEGLETCREPSRFSGWLIQIVRNRALNLLEHRGVRELKSEMESSPAYEIQQDYYLRKQLLVALSQLTPVQREVVLLYDLEGLSHAEIAEISAISEAMSRQHLMMARRKLREVLLPTTNTEGNHE